MAMQHSYSRTLKCSPYELLQQTSPFDYLQRHIKQEKTERKNELDKFEEAQFEIGDQVLCKKFIRKKFDAHYEGPFKILNKRYTTYLIGKKNCEIWINQRYLIKWRGGKCGVPQVL
jgi:hypothetical protein